MSTVGKSFPHITDKTCSDVGVVPHTSFDSHQYSIIHTCTVVVVAMVLVLTPMDEDVFNFAFKP